LATFYSNQLLGFWIKKIKSKSIYLYIHTLIHGGLTALLIGEIQFIWLAVLLAVTHGFIDYLKLYFQKKKNKRSWFLFDQFLHFFVITAISLFYTNTSLELSLFDTKFWILIAGIIFLTKPTSIIIKNIISIWTPESNDKEDNSLQNAGNYIGILERLFVFCFILGGHFEAIGFLLAAKSIFRFGDLKEAKDKKLTEYVLIGTLVSFGTALLLGLLVQIGITCGF